MTKDQVKGMIAARGEGSVSRRIATEVVHNFIESWYAAGGVMLSPQETAQAEAYARVQYQCPN